MTPQHEQQAMTQERFRDDPLSVLANVLPSEHTPSVDSEMLQIQVVTAKKYPRSIKKFMAEAESMATINAETAESMFYSVPRSGKTVSGPSIRLAEICMSAWGHLDCGTRIKEVSRDFILVEGHCWDMAANCKVRQELRRNIRKKDGSRYGDDMIAQTINAGASIALRNAILRVIPRAYIDQIWEKARLVAVGDAKTLSARRDAALGHFLKIPGLTADRIFAALEVKGVEDITIDHLGVLQGYRTAIKDNEATVDDCFPPLVPEGQPKTLADKIRGNGTPKQDAPAETPKVEAKPDPEQAVPEQKDEPTPAPAQVAPEKPKAAKAKKLKDEVDPPAQPSLLGTPSIPLNMLDEIDMERVRVGWTHKILQSECVKAFGVLDPVTVEQAETILKLLANIPNARQPGDE